MNKNQIRTCVIIGFIFAVISLILGPVLIGLAEIVAPFNPISLGVILIMFGATVFCISYLIMIIFLID